MNYSPYAAVGSMMPVADDIEFWGRQESEHMLFMSLGLVDKDLKRRAEGLHNSWEAFRRGPRRVNDAIPLVLTTQEFKAQVLTRLNNGEFLGWLFPLFVDHIRREGDYFLAALRGQKFDSCTEAQIWLTFMAEHSAFAAHLLDPSEAEEIRKALELQSQLGALFHNCGSALSDQFKALTMKSGQDLDAYFNSLGIGKPDGAKSVIHPLLAEHVVREGRRFLQTMQMLQPAVSMAPMPPMA